jgi:predicted transcriptional regulator
MMQIGNEKTTTIKLDSVWLDRLDTLAKRAELSRRQLMMNMVDVGLDQIKVLKMFGFFKVGLLVRQMSEKSGMGHTWEETGELKPAPVTLKEKTWDLLDTLAEAGDISRHQLVRNIIYVGIEQLESFQKVGLFQIKDACILLKKSFNEIIEDGQKAMNAVHGK